MKIFLICPVRIGNLDKQTRKEQKRISKYVSSLKKRGHKVHWPRRDTKQKDSTGGYRICRTNFRAMMKADEIHIWYNEKSNGSKFDMGGVFMLVEMLGYKKKVIISNREEAEVLDRKKKNKKSFLKVMKHIAG